MIHVKDHMSQLKKLNKCNLTGYREILIENAVGRRGHKDATLQQLVDIIVEDTPVVVKVSWIYVSSIKVLCAFAYGCGRVFLCWLQ